MKLSVLDYIIARVMNCKIVRSWTCRTDLHFFFQNWIQNDFHSRLKYACIWSFFTICTYIKRQCFILPFAKYIYFPEQLVPYWVLYESACLANKINLQRTLSVKAWKNISWTNRIDFKRSSKRVGRELTNRSLPCTPIHFEIKRTCTCTILVQRKKNC